MATRKVRVKKLSTKTPLPVLREDQIEASEYESLTSEIQIATGVEQAEENVSPFALVWATLFLQPRISRVWSCDAAGHIKTRRVGDLHPQTERAAVAPSTVTPAN